MMVSKVILAFMFILLVVPLIASDTLPQITLNLVYKTGTQYDTDNDGVDQNIVDITVENTLFNWAYNNSKLCTRWDIYSIDYGFQNSICNGYIGCCNLIDMQKTGDNWNDVLYLQKGKYGATTNNKVTARVIYADYSLLENNAYSKIYFSDEDYLYAVFPDKDYSIPSVNSVQLQANLNEINITIHSPKQVVSSGEGIYLNLSLSDMYPAAYSLDGSPIISLGIDDIFYNKLNGTLEYGVLKNGFHQLQIYVQQNLSNVIEYNYTFYINDSTNPNINTTLKNLNLNDNPQLHQIDIAADEYCNTKAILNQQPVGNYETDIDKKTSFNISLQEGTNNLELDVTDFQNNSDKYVYVFNYSPPASCIDGIKNGDELNLDCGGSCPDCIDFELSLDKQTFYSDENVDLTILARANSAVNLTVIYQGVVIDSEYIPSYSPDFPIYITKTISNTYNAGSYLISATMQYMNHQETKTLSFQVNNRNPLIAVITANDSTINEGETISFNAVATGNVESETVYYWNFNDGSTSSIKSPKHVFPNNATYDIGLTVTWNGWQATDTKTITVKKLYNISIMIKNSTGNPLKDAIVEFNHIEKNTSTEGKATFLINPGEYELRVEKQRYIAFSNDTRVSNNNDITVVLASDTTDNILPEIQIISPNNNETLATNNISIKYKVTDESSVNCTLFTNLDGAWWLEGKTTTDIRSSQEMSFSLDNLDDGNYQLKIDCIDASKNLQTSSIVDFKINTSEVKAQQLMADILNDGSVSADQLLTEIDTAIQNLQYLNKESKDAADSLNLEKTLENARLEIERAKRDLHNLIWRRLNDSDLEVLEQSIKDKIVNIRDTTPISATVIDSKELIEYPSKDDIEKIALEVLDTKEKTQTKKEQKSYIEYNQDIQKYLTVTTKYKLIEMEYISGEKGTVTLIEKEIKINKDINELSLIEYIPKTIADNISRIKSFDDFNIIKEDPIISFDTNIERFSYYIPKELTLDEAKTIKTILLSNGIVKTNPAIGFAVFSLPQEIIDTIDIRLMIESFIIICLIIIYLTFSGYFKKFKYLIMNRKVLKNSKQINKKVDHGLTSLQNNDYESAKTEYKELNELFKALPQDIKKDLMKKVKLLSDRLNSFHLNKLLDRAFFSLDNKQKKEAVKLYKEVSSLYKLLSPRFKSRIIERCKELHKKLNEK